MVLFQKNRLQEPMTVNYMLDTPAKGFAALDPHHTHHFLVDDGTVSAILTHTALFFISSSNINNFSNLFSHIFVIFRFASNCYVIVELNQRLSALIHDLAQRWSADPRIDIVSVLFDVEL